MVYKWLFELSDKFSFFNVFQYITFRSFLSFFTAFFVCWVLGPFFIQVMKNRLLSEGFNSDRPQTHLKKKGTPSMGGGLILLCICAALLFWVDLSEPLVWATLGMTLGFSLIGFWDDWIKIRYKNIKGLSVKKRLFMEFLISGIIFSTLWWAGIMNSQIHFPFFKNMILDLGVGYIFLSSFLVVGFANAVNLTDGLDGLAIFPIMICACTLGLLSYLAGHYDLASYLGIPFISGAGELTPFAFAVAAGALGFLWYNTYPAQIFMGDIGSLGMGAFLGTLFVITKNELLIPILGGVFVVEALSVISQVFSFRLTGKRIFSMAPLHHHFEMKGIGESKIIVRFWIISLLLALLSLATLKIR